MQTWSWRCTNVEISDDNNGVEDLGKGGMPVVGIPVKILHEAEGHIVSCETIMGETYRGKLIEAEDNMNLQMQG